MAITFQTSVVQRRLADLFLIFISHVIKTKNRNRSINKFKKLGYDDDCNINNLAKNQVSAVFNSRAIRKSVSSKFIEICMETWSFKTSAWSRKILVEFHGSRSLVFSVAVMCVSQSRFLYKAVSESRFFARLSRVSKFCFVRI